MVTDVRWPLADGVGKPRVDTTRVPRGAVLGAPRQRGLL
jgi:hypothetical protein